MSWAQWKITEELEIMLLLRLECNEPLQMEFQRKHYPNKFTYFHQLVKPFKLLHTDLGSLFSLPLPFSQPIRFYWCFNFWTESIHLACRWRWKQQVPKTWRNRANLSSRRPDLYASVARTPSTRHLTRRRPAVSILPSLSVDGMMIRNEDVEAPGCTTSCHTSYDDED